MEGTESDFEWDAAKEVQNMLKHGVDFGAAQRAFGDPRRLIAEDLMHSEKESRFTCLGRVGHGVLTVRFTIRGRRIRIIGAGYWRKGRKLYEKTNQIHG